MIKAKQNKYNIGDIVFVNKYVYSNKKEGNNHLFVIINDDNEAIPLEYFGFLVSSHIEKRRNKSKYIYNEFLMSNEMNGLKVDSIVKCDQLYNFPNKNIIFKIGNVSVHDFLRFVKVYKDSLKEKN